MGFRRPFAIAELVSCSGSTVLGWLAVALLMASNAEQGSEVNIGYVAAGATFFTIPLFVSLGHFITHNRWWARALLAFAALELLLGLLTLVGALIYPPMLALIATVFAFTAGHDAEAHSGVTAES